MMRRQFVAEMLGREHQSGGASAQPAAVGP
jgi:hypothetical protein